MSEPVFQSYFARTVGIEFLECAKGEALTRLTVTENVCQKLGVMSGSASLVLAETTAGYGSRIILDDENVWPFGVQVSANHLRMVKEGDTVTARGTCLSAGKTVHVWNVDVTDGRGNLVSTARVVNIVKRKNPDVHK